MPPHLLEKTLVDSRPMVARFSQILPAKVCTTYMHALMHMLHIHIHTQSYTCPCPCPYPYSELVRLIPIPIINTFTYLWLYIHLYIYLYIYMYKYTCIHTCIPLYTYTHIRCVFVCWHIHTMCYVLITLTFRFGMICIVTSAYPSPWTVGGEGTTNVCAFTWRLKMHSDISLRSCVTGWFLPLLKAKEMV